MTENPIVKKCALAAVAWVDEMKLRPFAVEEIVICRYVAGTCDLAAWDEDGNLVVVDWKSTNKPAVDLPKDAYSEHREQIGFYTAAHLAVLKKERARSFVVYLSTAEPGAISPCEVTDWKKAYTSFKSLYDHWCYRNSYWPQKSDMTVEEKLAEAGL